MAEFRPCSDRTKRRRVANRVSNLLAKLNEGEACEDPHSDCNNIAVQNDIESNNNGYSSVIGIQSDQDDISGECTYRQDNAFGEEQTDVDSDAEFQNENITEADVYDDCSEWQARTDIKDSSDDDADERELDADDMLQDQLQDWAITYGISQNALSGLLHILQPSHPNLPKDARSILQTRRKVDTKLVAGGEYYYFGVQYWLRIILQETGVELNVDLLHIHINIDGIPLFNSNSTALWPILGSVIEIPNSQTFPIAIYSSLKKPTSLDEYLSDFILEMNNLHEQGIEFMDKNYKVKLDAIICDAPARAFIKCIKPHSGYNSCERCMQHGEWCNKIIFPDLSAPLLTDKIFAERHYPEHHVGYSPFLQLSVNMVTDFPLDYMHLVCLGVVRRILFLWIHGPRGETKLSQLQVTTISNKLVILRQHIPREFARKPRSLSEYKQWKATELRQFLLYTGPVVLKGILKDDMYSNFLDFSVAIRLLLSPNLVEQNLAYTEQLIKYFVASFAKLYGKNQLVYNVHSLIHLPDDARRFGVLDNISSFRYESYLGRLKKLVRRPQNPTAQIVRRILEGHCKSNTSIIRGHLFKGQHMAGPLPIKYRHCLQYTQYNGADYLIATTTGDNCFMVDGKVGVVKNILHDPTSLDPNNVIIMFEAFENPELFFSDPLDSKVISVYLVTKLSGIRHDFTFTNISTKCFLLPYKNGFVVFPQMHSS